MTTTLTLVSVCFENSPTVLEPDPEPSKRYQIHIIWSPFPPACPLLSCPAAGPKTRGKEEKLLRYSYRTPAYCNFNVGLFPLFRQNSEYIWRERCGFALVVRFGEYRLELEGAWGVAAGRLGSRSLVCWCWERRSRRQRAGEQRSASAGQRFPNYGRGTANGPR